MRYKMFSILIGFLCIFSCMDTIHAEEGKTDSYWGNIPEDKTFAFVDSRYYDGTNEVEVFNVGIYTGVSKEYYTNGDWTDMTKVYRREEYYKNDEYIDFSNNGKVGDVKPEGYPTNDVGGDAEGRLPSYNAGTYTTLSWTNFSMFGRYWFSNYNISAVINADNVATYVEIWKVDPLMKLTSDKDILCKGDTVTLTATIENHFDNMEGLPTAEQMVFSCNQANIKQFSSVVKKDNTYTVTFTIEEDVKNQDVQFTAQVKDSAINYNEGKKDISLKMQTGNVDDNQHDATNGVNTGDDTNHIVWISLLLLSSGYLLYRGYRLTKQNI